MGARGKLFRTREIYDLPGTEEVFVTAMRELCAFHYQNCPEYRAILDARGFQPDSLRTAGDLEHAGSPPQNRQ